MNNDDVVLEEMSLGAGGNDVVELADFLTNNCFPFHLRGTYSRSAALESAASDRWYGENARTYRIRAQGCPVGIILCEDLKDPTIMIDIRLSQASRGRGLGTIVLRRCAALLFETCSGARRIEGQTREDNIAMRRAFLRAGWVREAYLRDGWDDGYAAVVYSILRRDWESGTTTPVIWGEPAS